MLSIVFLWAVVLICNVEFSESYNTCRDEAECEHLYSEDYLMDVYYSGLRRVTANAHSMYCKQYIEFEFMKYIRAMTEESPFPFENIQYHSQCPSVEHPPLNPIVKKTISLSYPAEDPSSIEPARSYSDTKHPNHLSILYVILVHSNPDFALRLINALDEKTADNKLQHNFVIHVDRTAEETQQRLLTSTLNRDNIHILSDEWRETISWGGFSIVNATLNCMHYAFHLGLPFDFLIDLSGTHYPIKSNHFIRQTLASNLNTVFMDVMAEPNRPESHMWQHYVECDGALHRIARMPLIKGINMHVGSQWFALPHHAVVWLLRNHLPRDYIQYAKHIIIADENYFATMFKNSPYCTDTLNRNLLFVLFDKFEHERNSTTKPRDNKKCLSYDPDNCGRSPTTLTMEFKYLLGSSRSLFARKFDPQDASSMALVDYIDSVRGTGIDRLSLSTALESNLNSAAADGVGVGVGGVEYSTGGGEVELNVAGIDVTPNVTPATVEMISNTSRDTGSSEGVVDEEVLRRIDQWDTNRGSGREQITMIKLGGLTGSNSSNSSGSDGAVDNNIGVGSVLSSKHADRHYNTELGTAEGATAGDSSTTVFTHDVGEDVSTALCMEYAPRVNNLIGMMRCDPANSNQWFQIGRCSEGYEIQLHDNACPSFHKIDSTTDSLDAAGSTAAAASATADGSDDPVFCSLLVGDYSEDLCMDISGESATYNNPLIGYDCTGRWNQLFRLSSDCTVRALQPAVIGRVRGSESDVELCVEATATNHLVTAACYDSINTTTSAATATDADTSDSDSSAVTEEGEEVRWHRSRQQYQFLPAEGSLYKKYMMSSSAP